MLDFVNTTTPIYDNKRKLALSETQSVIYGRSVGESIAEEDVLLDLSDSAYIDQCLQEGCIDVVPSRAE